MDLQPVKSASASAHQRISLPSGAPAEHLTVGEMLEKHQKFEEEKLLWEEEKQKRKHDLFGNKPRKTAQKLAQNMMHK